MAMLINNNYNNNNDGYSNKRVHLNPFGKS